MLQKIKEIIDNLGYDTCIKHLYFDSILNAQCIIAKKSGLFSTTVQCFLLDFVDEDSLQSIIKYIERQKKDSLKIVIFKMNFKKEQTKFTYISSNGEVIHFLYLQPDGMVNTETDYISYWKSNHVNRIISAIKTDWAMGTQGDG